MRFGMRSYRRRSCTSTCAHAFSVRFRCLTSPLYMSMSASPSRTSTAMTMRTVTWRNLSDRAAGVDPGQQDFARDAGDGTAADPDGPRRVFGDVHAPGPPEGGALAGGVRRRSAPGGDEPLREAGVERAGHRVLDGDR